MMFSSKTPRDLNRDPMPWSVGDPYGHELRSEVEPPENAIVDWSEFDPRPEYDHPQNNEPNPILVEFRDIRNGTGNDLFTDAYLFSGDLIEDWDEYDPAHWDHAMKVLTRLLRWTKTTYFRIVTP